MTTEVSDDTSSTDLAGYFDRTGYCGPSEPTVAMLHALVASHNRAIPFENLDPSPAARGPRWASRSPTLAPPR